MSIKRRILGITVILITVLLGACSAPVDDSRLQFSLGPEGNLGYSVSENGTITIESRFFTFNNPPGAPGLQLNEVEVTFYDDAGTPIPGAVEGVITSLNLYIPAGLTCDELIEGTAGTQGCTMTSTNPQVAVGPIVQTAQAYQMLDASVAVRHLMAGEPTAWYAEFVFRGIENGLFPRDFESEPYRVAIVAPN